MTLLLWGTIPLSQKLRTIEHSRMIKANANQTRVERKEITETKQLYGKENGKTWPWAFRLSTIPFRESLGTTQTWLQKRRFGYYNTILSFLWILIPFHLSIWLYLGLLINAILCSLKVICVLLTKFYLCFIEVITAIIYIFHQKQKTRGNREDSLSKAEKN